MSNISKALTTPLTIAPPIWFASVPQTKYANKIVTTSAKGIAREAGQFNMTKNIKTTTIGVKASKANTPKLIFFPLKQICYLSSTTAQMITLTLSVQKYILLSNNLCKEKRKTFP